VTDDDDADALVDIPASYDVVESATPFRSGRVIDVRTDVVRMPGGETTSRDVVRHPGAVGVIALDDAGRVLLVRQYRHPVKHMCWEPPAGLLDEVGEDPLAAAKRELFEEAHHRAERWDVLVDAFTSPGMTEEAVRIYLARDVHVADGDKHKGEHEEVDMPTRWVDLDEAADAVLAGRLHNPMAAMGVLSAARARADDFSMLRPAAAPWPQMSSWPGSAADHDDI
jgi:8-oxo-dGTP pyrophosphatase MutT (NUDIX family)